MSARFSSDLGRRRNSSVDIDGETTIALCHLPFIDETMKGRSFLKVLNIVTAYFCPLTMSRNPRARQYALSAPIGVQFDAPRKFSVVFFNLLDPPGNRLQQQRLLEKRVMRVHQNSNQLHHGAAVQAGGNLRREKLEIRLLGRAGDNLRRYHKEIS